MKKNSTMRVAALLLALTLMTSCFVGGTFAKYTTGDDANDSARVARWGVTATVTGTAFAENYELKAGGGLAVESSTGENVIAPGTAGEFTGISVTGVPEVAVNIETTANISIEGFKLAGDVFYCPVVITINGVKYCGLQYNNADAFVADLKAAIEVADGNYGPNTDLSGVTGLNGNYAWEWAFEDSEHTCVGTHVNGDQTDGRDTELGNKAANGFLNKITISVETVITQVD